MCHGTKTKKFIPVNKEKHHRANIRPYCRTQKHKLQDEHETFNNH